LHDCTLIFLYLFLVAKEEIDHIVVPLEVVCLRPSLPQFLKYGHVPPHPLHTMIPQSKIIILCSICTHRLCELQLAASQKCLQCAEICIDLCFGGNGGMPGLSRVFFFSSRAANAPLCPPLLSAPALPPFLLPALFGVLLLSFILSCFIRRYLGTRSGPHPRHGYKNRPSRP